MSGPDPIAEGQRSDEPSESPIARIPIKRFGPYNLIGRLGFGGMAEVFLAFTAGPGTVRKLVVVKRLHRHLRDSKDFVRMFHDEARLAAQFNHPNVISTYELGEIDGSYFISMEYLQGQSFDRLLRLQDRGDQVVWNQIVAQVLVDALDGLHYAHEFKDFDGTPYNIIHRDISPQNIFATYEGISKVLDFGVAKASTQMDTTESGVLKGKCAYVAPEQAYGDKVDRRADLWAMGVVLWEGLAGRRLFKAETNAATLLEVLTSEIPLVMDLSSDIPLSLGQIVEKALQRDPSKRYATAKRMKEDLEQFLKELPKRISRQQVGDFVSRAFTDVRNRQLKVVEECLSDAVVSRRPKEKKRGPDLQALSSPGSQGLKISSLRVGRGREGTRPESPPLELLVRRKENVKTPAPERLPPTSEPSVPSAGSAGSSPQLTPPPSQAQSTRQSLLFIALALVLAVLAAVAAALIYQSVVLGRQGSLDPVEQGVLQRVASCERYGPGARGDPGELAALLRAAKVRAVHDGVAGDGRRAPSETVVENAFILVVPSS